MCSFAYLWKSTRTRGKPISVNIHDGGYAVSFWYISSEVGASSVGGIWGRVCALEPSVVLHSLWSFCVMCGVECWICRLDWAMWLRWVDFGDNALTLNIFKQPYDIVPLSTWPLNSEILILILEWLWRFMNQAECWMQVMGVSCNLLLPLFRN